MSVENITSDGGVTKQILKAGSGAFPQKDDEVTMLYKGSLLDGSIFDSNQNRDNGFKFTLGVAQVIKGWDLGVITMQIGEQAILTIQPEYGYGDQSMGDKLPANSTLVFEVELLSSQAKQKEKWDHTPEERMEMSLQWKEQGNQAFKEQNYENALVNYKKVTEHLEMDMKDSEVAAQMRVTCLSNCALVYFKSKDYVQAISFADMVLQNQPDNIKALFRKAQALSAQSNFDQAIKVLQQALKVEPENNDIKREIISVKNKIKAQDKKDKSVYANIFKNTFYDDQQVVKQAAPKEEEASELKHPKDCSVETNPRVFMDIQVGEEQETRRVEFELFSNICPRTAENFRALCTGEKGIGKAGKALHFKGCGFHRLIKGFMLQGGDFTNGDGTGGESIYGNKFDDEDFSVGHLTKGLLSMANAGKNTNGSQFFVTFKETPWLDGKHTVFGQVVNGLEHVEFIENIQTHQGDSPKQAISIADCGQL